ncbi:MAG: hypothetical protein V3W19_05415 [Desulfatiglandales bacterium]
MREKIEVLEKIKKEALSGSGIEKIKKHHEKGKLRARGKDQNDFRPPRPKVEHGNIPL